MRNPKAVPSPLADYPAGTCLATRNPRENPKKRLHDAGMGYIMIQGAPFLFQVAMTEFLSGVKQDLGLSG
jgi:F420-dependent methylenetetrahydromethanopterin dehydrogenase